MRSGTQSYQWAGSGIEQITSASASCASQDKLLELVRQAQSKWGAEIPVDLVLVGSGGVMDAEQMFARMTRVWGVDEAHVRVLEGGFEAWRDLRDNFNR